MSVFLETYTDIGRVLKQHGAQRPFVCCGKSFQQSAIFQYLKQYNIVVFDHIRPNPRFEDMVTAAELFTKEGCDFMIAAGGGSPMDSAKMIHLMATNGSEHALEQPMANNDIPALFIPTTAGTGSEATKTAVFYVRETEKVSIRNYDFIPDYVLFDASLLLTLPEYQRKATCLDALCHAIESYWSTAATAESREIAGAAICLFWEHKAAYLQNEPAGNRGMLEASFQAGRAINLTGTTAPHAMGYALTMGCGLAHGHSVALVLSALWQFMLEREHPADVLTPLAQLMGGTAPQDGAALFAALLREMQLTAPPVDQAQIAAFTASVPPAKLQTTPIALDAADVRELYERALGYGV